MALRGVVYRKPLGRTDPWDLEESQLLVETLRLRETGWLKGVLGVGKVVAGHLSWFRKSLQKIPVRRESQNDILFGNRIFIDIVS